MITHLLSFTLLLAFTCTAAAQQSAAPARFKDPVFGEIRIQKNLLYKTTIPAGTKKKYYQFDFYEPLTDTAPCRPLIIWLHGGGFKFGKKTSAGTPVWSQTFAQRGYVCAAINYRLSKKHPLKNFPDLLAGCSTAIEDVQQAVDFFKLHYRQFRIDTNHIILGGNSAGGMIALQAVYSSPWEMAKLAHSADSIMPGNFVHNPQHIAAVISCWGALFNGSWLKNGTTPIVCIHGSADRVVNAGDKNPLLLGSLAIHRGADEWHIPNGVKIFEGYGHELQKHFNPFFPGHGARQRWLEADRFIAAFLYRQLFSTK